MNAPNVQPRLCKIDGCNSKRFARGWCNHHYLNLFYRKLPVPRLLRIFHARLSRFIPEIQAKRIAYGRKYVDKRTGQPRCGRLRKILTKQERKEYRAQHAKLPKSRQRRALYKKSLRGKLSLIHSGNKRRSREKESDFDSSWLLELYEKTKICSICNQALSESRHLDHIKPLCLGGTHTMDNVRYVHPVCNLRRPRDGSDIPSEL